MNPCAIVLLALALAGCAADPYQTPGTQHMAEQLAALAADANAEDNIYLSQHRVDWLRRQPALDDPVQQLSQQVELAKELLRAGASAEAATLFEQVREQAAIHRFRTRPSLEEMIALAYLRLGEQQNCIDDHNLASCLLPIAAEGVHKAQEGSRAAIAYYRAILKKTPYDLTSRWLLNIAYMTVGEYPGGVPERLLIPPETFESPERMPRFDNIAPALGLHTFDMCGGAIADDFDNDGYLDIVTSSWDPADRLRYFRNNRDGTFTERTEQAGLIGISGGLNLVQADYDNDGNVDVFVLRGAWLRERGRHPNSLLRNNGDGTFTDVTFDAGLGDVHYPSQTAAWADYDNDGDVDLYVGNETSRALVAPGQLFRNNGDGTFTDTAASAGVLNHRYAKAVTWGDYNGDRLPDLYVSNSGGANRLYRNTGRGTFVDEARRLRAGRPHESFPAWFWDVDNDGVLDLYVSAYIAGIEHLAADALGLPVGVERSRLYRGTGDGRFEEVSEQYGLRRPVAAMGANFGDLDNDGYPDFYLGTGYPPYHSLMPGVMYRNRGGQRFADVTYAGGFGHLQKGHGVFFADLDHDGDQDVFEQMGGAFPGDRFGNVLYENPGFGNHWITIRLVGVRANRSAIGARIRADIIEDGVRRSVYRHVNSGGSFGANPLRQTIGLGSAARIERLEVFWPTTGETQAFADVPVDRIIRIVEGESSYETLELETLRLAVGAATAAAN